jgi:membrane fusion protein, multidrug efflux system
MKSGILYAVTLVLVGAAAGGTALLSVLRNKAEADERGVRTKEIEQGPLVDTAVAVASPPTRDITVPGEVHALKESTLYAKVSGYLRVIPVDKGDRVKENDLLGVVEAPELEDQVRSKRADLAVKRIIESRYQMLEHNGLLSQQDMDQASANVNIAVQDLRQLETTSGYQVIRAPFAGVVTARFADPGALLQAATASTSALALVTLADLDRVRVQVFLAQSEALFIHEGDPAAVWAEEKPDVRAQATVTRLAHELDPRTRTMLTEVEIDNTKTVFYPGSIVRVKLTLTTLPALAVPADTIFESNGKQVIAVVENDRVRFSPVDVAETDGINVRVRSGVKVGDLLVRHPADDVVDGTHVRVAHHP